MRLRNGILTIVFGTLLITAALLLAYYNLFLSNATATEFETLQTDLDNECALFASQLPLQQDISRYLDVQAGRTGYQFHLLNLEGQTLYRTAEQNEPAISINATSPLQFNGQTILLRVTKFISIKTATSIPAVQKLLLAGIVILLITLPIIYLVLYLYYVRPIVRLQRDMEQYKSGEKPVGSKRRDEIGKLQNAFVQLTDDLDLEKQKQNRLIASISHDIKTPLTSVMGYAERLQNSTLSPERSKRYIATIYEKAQRIRDLVDEFDDYLSCNMPGTLKKQTVTTNRLFALFEEEYQQDLSELGVSLTLTNRAPLQPISVDIAKLRRVFGNLVANSLKHFDKPEMKIALSCHMEYDWLFFAFSDNGEGVEASELRQIFDPLFTSDVGRSVAGLGLSICHEIIIAHNGKIWAEPNEEEGSGLRVCFVLPRVKDL